MDINNLQDGLRAAEPNPLSKIVLTRELDGVPLSLNVSPCSWMYPTYGLQVQVTMAGGGNVYIHDKTLPFEKATEADLNQMFDQVRLVACTRCGKPAFDPSAHKTNRAGLCEACFVADLDVEFKKAQETENTRMKRMDAKRKKEGFTHRVDAWIHPKRGGSDYQIAIYVKGEPSEAFIKAELGKKSSVTTDYTVTKL